jgi:DNA-binding HxlR family transcriptional regulator
MSPAPLDVPAVAGRPCSVAAALEIIGDRWSLLIVREVLFGNHRFGEIARNTGAPRDRLAARLKELVAAGVLEQREYQASPPRSDYHLTKAGRDLGTVLQVLREWGDRWAVESPPVSVRHHDHELKIGGACSVCGEPVRARDLTREMHVPDWDMAGPRAAD